VRRSLALLALVALAGCGSSDKEKTTGTETSAAAQQSTTSGCRKVAAPRPKPDGELDRPSLKIDRTARWRATIDTNCGAIEVALDVRDQPKTVASFVYLARRGFFNGVIFHRIAQSPNGSDFVIQGGDPTGTGQGGPGYSVTERPPSDTQYTRGIVAMAKTEVEPPGTSGSQFFVVTAQDAGLPPDYAILGRVVGSDAAVRKIAATPADPRTQRPTTPVVIQKISVRRG
jgi:cyclophilin family peptidyl-prolyl cis-trans isomerase